MFGWFTRKSKLERLKTRHRDLMRKSYELSLNDPEKSEKLHRQAEKVYEELQKLNE